jgi:hypothetical protein
MTGASRDDPARLGLNILRHGTREMQNAVPKVVAEASAHGRDGSAYAEREQR